MPVFNNILAGASGQSAGGGGRDDYTIQRSLRLDSSSSGYLYRNVATAGDLTKWTWSAWFKRGKDTEGSTNQNLWAVRPNGNNQQWIRFESSSNAMRLYLEIGSSIKYDITTTQVFRDSGAWYHVVLSYDSTIASPASDRVKLFINGERVTSFASATYPQQNQDSIFNNAETEYIGQRGDGNNKFDGLIADVQFVDGEAKVADDFGELNSTTGVWGKKVYSGSYGSNGYALDFSDTTSAATLGADAVGSNNFTLSGIANDAGGEITVGAATGALPVLTTTGDQGGTANSPHTARSDSNGASLELALPLNTLNDFSGNSRTVGGSGVTLPSTNLARFYGGASYFDGNSQLTIANVNNIFDFGTGDFTVEVWARPNSTSGDQYILSWECSGPNAGHAGFNIYQGNWRLGAFNNDLTGGNDGLAAGKWVHLAMAREGTTLRTFINGVLKNNFTNSDNFSATTDLTLGKYAGNATLRFAGYMNDFRVYKGVAKYTSSFNPPTAPDYAAAAGNDSLFDSPENNTDGSLVSGNYATFHDATRGNGLTLENANLDVNGGSSWGTAATTMYMSSGKWYSEYTIREKTSSHSYGIMVGLCGQSEYYGSGEIGSSGDSYAIQNGPGDMKVNYNGTSSGQGPQAAYAAGDVLQLAWDADNGKLFFGKNGTWINSGDPAAGTNAVRTNISGTYCFAISLLTTADKISANFGQRSFAFSPPSGFKGVCTENLTAPTITKPDAHFGVLRYTGNSTNNRNITGLNFNSQPEFVWIKNIDNHQNQTHAMFDRARGTDMLAANSTNTEAQWRGANGYPYRGYIDSFDTNGFQLDAGAAGYAYTNENTIDFMAWCWEGGTAFSNSAGTNNASIASSGYANNTAGMSVVVYSYTGTSAQTYAHGMNAAPDVVFRKARNLSEDWSIYHRGRGFYYRGHFNNQNSFTATTTWHSTGSGPTSQINRINNSNTGNYVEYCFRAVEGYSSFGTYEGNASSNGAYVHCGFRPRWILTKNADSSGEWAIRDTVRDPFNVSQRVLTADSSEYQQEHSVWNFDILSTGFKLRTASNGSNSSGHTFVYMAFAEHPLKYARAR